MDEAEGRKQLLEALFDHAPDVVAVTDADGRIAEVNAQVENIFGYTRAELLGLPIEVLIPERFRTAHQKHRKHYAAEPHVRPMGTRLELCGKRKNGEEFPADVALSPVETPRGRAVLCVIRDITERKRAEEAQRHGEQLHALFKQTSDALLLVDREGQIREVNPQLERHFGYSRDELVGQAVEMLVPEELRVNHGARRGDYMVRPHPSPMAFGKEVAGRRKDGSLFPADVMLSLIDTAEGRAVLCVVRDISEKIHLQEELERKEQERHFFEQELNADPRFEDIIGVSPRLRRVLREVENVAATDATVLILGETGTGKDVIARAIHQLSSRSERSLITLNCAAIPTGLLESELFGHERGAFTGAISQKIGRLELAHRGTLVLDEIGDLPLELQPKLLRVLQERKFERLGGTRTIPVDIRLIAATNRDLHRMVDNRQFRSDLYYRLKVFPITLPPLRERREDIPFLVRYFVSRHARNLGKRIETIPPDIMKSLTRWDWPGNIRELENFIERSVILTKGTILRAPLAELVHVEEAPANEDSTLEAIERDHILSVLRETRGTISGPHGAATRLGLKRTTLNSKLKKIGIQPKDYR